MSGLSQARQKYVFVPYRELAYVTLGVYKLVDLTPPLLALRGSLGELIADNDRRIALR